MFDREIKLIGEQKFAKISYTKIIVFGVGGVGGFVVEFLARAGIQNICLVDFDVVDKSNKNRQIIALNSTIGKNKVEVLSDRIKEINENINIKIVNSKLTKENIKDFKLENYDYVVDAIDDFDVKCELIKYCYFNNIKVISSMGCGNKIGIPNYVVADINKTSYDPIAKKLRKYCKENCIKHHNVIYSSLESIKLSGACGSISYHPPACASVLTGFIINDIIGD